MKSAETTRRRSLAAAVGLLALVTGAAAATQMPGDPAGPYILADAETGEVFEHFDALRPWYPASTTKLMTTYVAFRAILAGELTLDSPVVVSQKAAAEPPSKMGFKPGSVLTLDDALKIMMVKSANDIAMAVAETVGGSEAGFADRMNAEARRLGMTRSHFVNPHGLPDPRQVTTARDMAVLAKSLLVEFPQHRPFFRIPAIQLGGTVMKNFNPLLERYPGANGMKTGFICASGYNLVASARREGREVIAVVFGEYGGMARAEHAAELLDEGFQSGGAGSEARTTLANVASGAAYTAPLDMRPFVCSPDRAPAASEANTESAPPPASAPPPVAVQIATAASVVEPASHLGPPIYLGPPVQISLMVNAAAKYGEPGFAARIPRPRPPLPSDPPRAAVADAFVPIAGSGDGAAAAQAIGSALGAASLPQNVGPQ